MLAAKGGALVTTAHWLSIALYPPTYRIVSLSISDASKARTVAAATTAAIAPVC